MSAHTLRLFVGVYPPGESIPEIHATLRKLPGGSRDRVRRTADELIHLTVLFVGEVDTRNLDEIAESVQRSCAGVDAFSLTPQRVTTLPTGGRNRPPPRVVALETDTPGQLGEIRSRLITRLARHARLRPNDRFTPHFTLARVRHGERIKPFEERASVRPIPVSSVRLVRSKLLPSGAAHDPVAEYALV